MIYFEPPYIVVIVFFTLILTAGACLGGLVTNSYRYEGNQDDWKLFTWLAILVPTSVGIFTILFLMNQVGIAAGG